MEIAIQILGFMFMYGAVNYKNEMKFGTSKWVITTTLITIGGTILLNKDSIINSL